MVVLAIFSALLQLLPTLYYFEQLRDMASKITNLARRLMRFRKGGIRRKSRLAAQLLPASTAWTPHVQGLQAGRLDSAPDDGWNGLEQAPGGLCNHCPGLRVT